MTLCILVQWKINTNRKHTTLTLLCWFLMQIRAVEHMLAVFTEKERKMQLISCWCKAQEERILGFQTPASLTSAENALKDCQVEFRFISGVLLYPKLYTPCTPYNFCKSLTSQRSSFPMDTVIHKGLIHSRSIFVVVDCHKEGTAKCTISLPLVRFHSWTEVTAVFCHSVLNLMCAFMHQQEIEEKLKIKSKEIQELKHYYLSPADDSSEHLHIDFITQMDEVNADWTRLNNQVSIKALFTISNNIFSNMYPF